MEPYWKRDSYGGPFFYFVWNLNGNPNFKSYSEGGVAGIEKGRLLGNWVP